MAKYSLVVLSNATSGRDDEFNDWYDRRHLQDVLCVPGFVAAQRFRLAQPDSTLPGKYLAIYEMETDDPAATMAELVKRAGTDALVLSEALDVNTVSTTLFAAIGPRLTAAEVAAGRAATA